MFKLKLKNYRSFLDEEFEFSRINILIGENSAGKSSVFKFLLALKQSFRSPNNRESNLTFSSNDTDLGNYQEVVYNHETDRNISFAAEYQNDYFDFYLNYIAPLLTGDETDEEKGKRVALKKNRENIIRNLGGEISSPTRINFEITNDLSEHSNVLTEISNEKIGRLEIIHPKNIENQAEQDIYVVGKAPTCNIKFHSKEFDETFYFEKVEFTKEAFLSIIDGDSLESKIKKISKENSTKIYNQIGFLLIVQNYISEQLSRIEYINPLLSAPAERIYLEGDRRNSFRVADIKGLIDLLSGSSAGHIKDDLIGILSALGLADQIHVKREGFTRELRLVLNGIDNNIKDVGFGVSLQLPIFAQAIISNNSFRRVGLGGEYKRGETLLIEQPEVHLHPRLQAKFIDVLLKIGENNTYFIETHSEHIIRMLQIMVKENRYDLKSEDVSIHYLRKLENKTQITSHKIGEHTGKLEPNFPKGFYDVSYDLAFQLMD